MTHFTQYNDNLANEEKNLFGRPPIQVPFAYDTFLLPQYDLDDYPMYFTCPKLNMAASSIRDFIAFRRKYQWYHVVVYQSVFKHFYDEMTKTYHEVLPFWCWCDGGNYKHEPHRHMIVVCLRDKDYYRPYFKAEPIHSPQELVRIIVLLSGKQSQCSNTESHFYINLRLPDYAAFILACLWEKGLEQYMDLMQDVIAEDIFYDQTLPNAIIKDALWKVPVKAFPVIPDNLILPVPKHFKPTAEPTERVLHLIHGRKLYFEMDETLKELDDEAWMNLQANGGNVFGRTIQDERWTPNDRHQKLYSSIQQFLERMKKEQGEREACELDLKETKEKLDAYKDELERMKKEQGEREACELDLKETKEKLDAYKYELNLCEDEMKKTKDKLKMTKRELDLCKYEYTTMKKIWDRRDKRLENTLEAMRKQGEVNEKTFITMLENVINKPERLPSPMENVEGSQ